MIRVTEVASDWQFSLGFPIVVVFVFAIVAIAREIYLPQDFARSRIFVADYVRDAPSTSLESIGAYDGT